MCTSRTCYIGNKSDIVVTFLQLGLLQGKDKTKRYICDDCTDILDLCRTFVTDHTFVFHHIDSFTARTSYVHCIEDIVEPIIKVLFDTGCNDGRVLCLMVVLNRIMMNYSNEDEKSLKQLQNNFIKFINLTLLPSYDWVKFEIFVRAHCHIKSQNNVTLIYDIQKYIGTVLLVFNMLITLYRSFMVK